MRSLHAALAASAAVACAGAAPATIYTYTITGTTVAPPSDPLNIYQYPSDPTVYQNGEAFTLTYQVDDASPTALYTYGAAGSSARGGGFVQAGTTPPVTATIAIGGTSYTVRQGNSYTPPNIDPTFGDKNGDERIQQDEGTVQKSGTSLSLSARYDDNTTSYVSSYPINIVDHYDELSISLNALGFMSGDYRETGSFALAPSAPGLFLTANDDFYYAGDFTVDYTAAGLLPTHLTISSVPEPASWALMLTGFGAVGITARRRARAVLA